MSINLFVILSPQPRSHRCLQTVTSCGEAQELHPGKSPLLNWLWGPWNTHSTSSKHSFTAFCVQGTDPRPRIKKARETGWLHRRVKKIPRIITVSLLPNFKNRKCVCVCVCVCVYAPAPMRAWALPHVQVLLHGGVYASQRKTCRCCLFVHYVGL